MSGDTAADRETSSGIEIGVAYDEGSLGGWDAAVQLGAPGAYPYTRGPYPTMYRGRLWTMRQYAGFGTAEETNERFKALLAAGQTGLSVAFDLPTQMGYDSDHPMAAGEVGKVGVAIDSLSDMRRLFDSIPLGEVSTSMTINATAAMLLLLYQIVSEEQGAAPADVRGTVQNDILKEYIARGTYIFPAAPSMRLVTDLFAYCAAELPNWNTISISGYHIREAGSTAAQEIAFTIANGLAYVEAAVAAGLDVDDVRAPPLVLLECPQPPLRGGGEVPGGSSAVGQAHEGADRGDSGTPPARCGSIPRRLAPRSRPSNRSPTSFGRHTRLWRRPWAAPSRFTPTRSTRRSGSRRHSRRPWPCAPSRSSPSRRACRTPSTRWPVRISSRASPTALEAEAQRLIDEVDALGGAVAAIDAGFPQREIEDAAYREATRLEKGESVLVGVNRFVAPAEAPIPILAVDPELERGQVSRTQEVRSGRDADAVAAGLAEIRAAAVGGDNVLYPMKRALASMATVGEVSDVLRDVFGRYRPAH